MNIQDLIRSLSISELDKLINTVKIEIKFRKEKIKEQREKNRSGITIEEFTKEVPMSNRLRNTLRSGYGDMQDFFLEDLTKKEFHKMRNAGMKTWNDYTDIINNKLQGTIFEPQQEMLKKFIAEQEKQWSDAKALRMAERQQNLKPSGFIGLL
jgi:hypothetical protein